MHNPTIDQQLASAIGVESGNELREALQKIVHCLNQLAEEQVWWRPDETQNSIGNLMLHLCGNLRQWIVSGLGGEADERNRPQEFAELGPILKADLLGKLEAAVADSADVLLTLTATEWLRVRRIQGFEVTGLAAVFNTVPHFRGHTQEIIFRTRCLLGRQYEFSWKPSSPEQGAPE
jgi:hypothetical protein